MYMYVCMRTYICIYIYIYILYIHYIYTYMNKPSEGSCTGYYYHFNNLRFQTITANNDCSAAWSAFHLKHVVFSFVSRKILKRRSLK